MSFDYVIHVTVESAPRTTDLVLFFALNFRQQKQARTKGFHSSHLLPPLSPPSVASTMAPSFDTLSEHDLHEEEDEEVDFSGECDSVESYPAPLG